MNASGGHFIACHATGFLELGLDGHQGEALHNQHFCQEEERASVQEDEAKGMRIRLLNTQIIFKLLYAPLFSVKGGYYYTFKFKLATAVDEVRVSHRSFKVGFNGERMRRSWLPVYSQFADDGIGKPWVRR